ncbi:MAG: RCC1-like domain-containing protein [Planctomycetota bacterium]|jgi:alpha-tubulin suppressor-like RCC1 family protein
MYTKSALLTTCAVGAILLASCGGGGGGGVPNIPPKINDSPPIEWDWTTAAPITLDLTAYASDNETAAADLIYTLVTQPSATDVTWGTVGAVDVDDVFTAPTAVAYTPGSHAGVEYFEFSISDGVSSDTATVWVGVNNTAPAGPGVTVTLATDEETPLDITVADLGVTDANGDPVLFQLGTQPAHDDPAISFPATLVDLSAPPNPLLTYTPELDYPTIPAGGAQIDTFDFTVTDMVGTSVVITVDITVTAVNDAPEAQDVTLNVQEGDSIGITLDGSDVDNDTPLTYYITSLPALGTLNDSGIPGPIPSVPHTLTGQLSFDAPLDEWGTYTFTYYVSDGVLDSAEATVTITVSPPVQTCWGWGRGNLGQLGLGIGQYPAKVEYADALSEPRDYVMVDGGWDHSVYMAYHPTDETYYVDRASGDNDWGQLGRGASYLKWPTPLSIAGTEQSLHAAAGSYHTLSVAKREFSEDNALGPKEEDYGVWGCGQNTGRLGNGLMPQEYTPVEMLFALPYINEDQIQEPVPDVTEVDPKPRFKMVAGGALHSIALDATGDVWAVGDNNHTQLSLAGNWARRFAMKINTTYLAVAGPGAGPNDLDVANIVDISARQYGNLALDDAGNAWFWGSGGTGWDSQGLTYLGGGYQDIAMGGRHAVFVRNGGQVWTIGSNEHGQLGDGTTTGRGNLQMVAIEDADGIPVTNFVQVAAGGNHSLALAADGRVFACGDNTQGQCGTGITGSPVLEFEEVRTSTTNFLDNVIYIGAGGEHSLAITQ